MKRLIIGMTAAMALALSGSARAADDTKTTESKTTVKHNDDGTGQVKSEKSTKTSAKGAGSTKDSSTYTKDASKNTMGGTTTKTEKKSTHDAPGMKNDKTTDVKDTVETDAHGNVVKHETTGPDGKTTQVK